MKLNQTVKRIVCFALSMLLVFGTVTPVFAATNETEKKGLIAEIIASIDLTSKRVEKKVVNHLDENMNPEMTEAEELLAVTDSDVQEAISLIENVIADAQAKLEVGTDASEDAYALLTDIVKTQTKAQDVYKTAEEDLAAAKANLEAAQIAYDEAVAIATEGTDEAAAQLEAAKEAVNVAEKAFNEVNSKLVVLDELLASAAADTNAWKAEAHNALAAAGAHLNESNADLDEALATLKIENAEFVASVEAFQTQSEVFTVAVNELAGTVEVAQEKETTLNNLYAEYEAVLAAYENAMAAFETEHGVSGLTYEDAKDVMTALSDAVTEAENNVKLAETAVTDAQAVIDEVQANIDTTNADIAAVEEEIAALDALVANVASEDEAVSAAAVHTLAGLVIKEYLANGLTVTEQAALSEVVEGSYGMSENGFYVVLNTNGTVAARYGYLLEDGVVNIYHMKSTDVTNYVTYNGTEYVLEENDGQYYIVVNGEVVNVYGNVAEGYYVVETWTEDRADVYAHQVLSLTDQNPTALSLTVNPRDFGIEYNPITLDLASLTANADGTYSTELLSMIKLVVYKNADASWSANVYTYGCTKDHTCSWKVWECSYDYVLRSIVIPVSVSYPTKTQVTYNGVWYDLMTAEDGSLYIATAEGNISLVANTNILGMVESYAHPYTVDCSANVGLVYAAGGAEDTYFELGEKVDVNSASLYTLKVNTLAALNEDLVEYASALANAQANKTTADNNLLAAKDALLAAETKYENAQANFDALTAAYEAYAEKDLGSLAKLPKNISELLTSANVDSLEDITALVEAISTLSNDKADAKDKLNAVVTLTQYIPMADIVIPENYEDMNVLEWVKFLYNFATTDLGKALLDTDSFQYEYFQAWLNALYAKVEVIKAGIVVVEEAEKTITSGLELVYAGAELSDASIETMIEKINTEVLSGTVAALTIAVDVVEVSDEMVKAINEQVVILRFEAATAKSQVDAAKAELEALQLQTPGGEALVAASERFETATAKYEALVEDVASLEASLVEAEMYRAQAQARYEELKAAEDEANKPAEGGEGDVELPTPEVDYVEPEQPETPAEPVQPSAPVVEEEAPVIYGYYEAPVVEDVVEEVEDVEEVENVVTDNEITIEEVVEIVDEETPLADGVTDIADEEVPLAASKEEENEAAPVAVAVAGTATVAAAGGAGFVFFRKRKFF